MATTTRFKDLPRYRGKTVGRQAVIELKGGMVNRRTFVKAASAVGMGLGLASLGIFPRGREALAHHGASYQIKGLDCPGYYEDSWPKCNKPCGPSCIYPNACEDSGHYKGYHRASGNWSLRPNQCFSGTEEFDGWIWQVDQACDGDGCGGNWVKYNCHDGNKIGASCGGFGDNSICKDTCGCSAWSPQTQCVTP